MTEERMKAEVPELVKRYIYDSENPNWNGLEQALMRCGFNTSETYNILMGVREGESFGE